MPETILASAMRMYDRGDFEGLKELASEAWPHDSSTTPAPGVAETCRYLFILAHRKKEPTTSNLWRARAMSAATLTDSIETIAGLILQPFFTLTDIESHSEARAVLAELLRLVPEGHPRAELFRGRLYHEKLAYSFAKDGRFEEAREAYVEASRHCEGDPRGALKVRGGAAITGYLALGIAEHGDLEIATATFIAEMEDIADEARQRGFPDVLEAAESNLDLMKARESQGWSPFETE